MAGFTGGCLCGKVRYSSLADPLMAGHCHCEACRRSSGTGHSTHVVVPRAALSLTGELRFHESLADSGNRVGRGFCPDCGSPICSRNSAMPDLAFLRASSLDTPDLVAPQMIVYAGQAPGWDHMDPALPRFAAMPEGAGPQAIQRSNG